VRERPDGRKEGKRALATFGGGCFWCLDAVFRRRDGVIDVRSGYSGGGTERPTYRDVCSGETGHAEVIQVEFDPERVDYASLLELFFAAHDPTTRNRQGADVGTQYRSAIFWHDEEQRDLAERAVREIDGSGRFPDPVVTEIVPFTTFWPAEEEHQDFYARNPAQPYCRFVIAPKLASLR
jgi:peptide-methionine (S)-S-oxide reductase